MLWCLFCCHPIPSLPMPTHLITGANRGIGLALARSLIARGDRVLGTARAPDAATALKALGDNVRVVPLDVSDPASIERLAGAVGKEPIDTLINNAAIASTSKRLDTIDVAELQNVFMVNTIAPLLVTPKDRLRMAMPFHIEWK